MSKLFLRSALILCIGSWSASSAFAQQVSLTINNGRVTLKATNATVRQILDEWARVGGTKVVNAEKLAGQPVTLTLIDEPEGQALETVLRSSAGYMVSERANPAANGSRYERIMLMGRTTPVTTTAAASNQNAYTANGPTPPGGSFQAEGPVNADDDGDPPQPTAPVVNPYAQAGAAPGTGAPGAVAGTNANGVPGMGTGLGQQQAAQAGGAGTVAQQPNAMPNPGYSNVYGQGNSSGSVGAAGVAGAGTGAISTAGSQPETKFDYANPQKYFQQRGQQGGTAMQPYPGVPMSPTGSGTGTGTGTTTGSATPGTGAPGTVTPQQVPNNQNPYSPNFNPYNLPAGGGVPSAPGTATPATPVEPDRAKYANPYVQPGTQQP
jgi:hypothetical protein